MALTSGSDIAAPQSADAPDFGSVDGGGPKRTGTDPSGLSSGSLSIRRSHLDPVGRPARAAGYKAGYKTRDAAALACVNRGGSG